MGLNDFINQNKGKSSDLEEQKRIGKIELFSTMVQSLYSDVSNEWLKSFIDDKRIIVNTTPVNITEEGLGSYTVNSLQISFSSRTVELIPKGTNIIGSDARIDVFYLGVARKMIVRAPEKMTSALQMVNISVAGEKIPKKKNLGQNEWKLVDNSDRMSLITLNGEIFQQMLVDIVTNG